MEPWNCLQVIAWLRCLSDESIQRYETSPEKPWSFAAARKAYNADKMFRHPALGPYESRTEAQAAAEAAEEEDRTGRLSERAAVERLRRALIEGRLEWAGKNAPAKPQGWMAERVLDHLEVWFDSDAVKRMWPQPKSIRLERWARKREADALKKGERLKKAVFCQEMRRETECTDREAKERYSNLDEKVRLGQGRPSQVK